MGRKELIIDLEKILKNKKIKDIVNNRINEFLKTNQEDDARWFEEIAYCILVANTSAKSGLKCIEEMKRENIILRGNLQEIQEQLRKTGHRYPQKRAEYIYKARKYVSEIKKIITKIKNNNKRREWLVKNINGIGMKEASHFLRNVGYLDYAIIDRHIIKILINYDLIDPTLKKKTITKKRYLKIENLLKQIAKEMKLKPGVLDLYLWYMSTGEILK